MLATNLLLFHAQVTGCRLDNVGSGLLLGGGISFFTPQVGLASDTSTAYDIVLPTSEGTLVTATPTNEYADLFWERATMRLALLSPSIRVSCQVTRFTLVRFSTLAIR